MGTCVKMTIRILRQFRQCFSGNSENHITHSHALAFHMLSKLDFEPIIENNIHRTILFTVSTNGKYYNYEFNYYKFQIRDKTIDISRVHKDILVDELVSVLFNVEFYVHGVLPIIVDKITPEYVEFAVCDELLEMS